MLVLIILLGFSAGLNAQISVFAGDDTSICSNSNLDISELEATITGIVTDGNWFTTGDGVFLPSGESMSTYSSTTGYIPGSQDQANGIFNLILVSDDPDGIGPMIEVSDNVSIVYQNAPALACNNAINITLDVQCEQAVNIDMLVPNPVEPVDRYIIEIMDESGNLISDNILTGEHIGQNITYTVGHECTEVTCSGSLSVTDNFAPVFICVDSQISCVDGNTADEIGLPIPGTATSTANGDQSYTVSGWDACGDVSLSYTDIETIPACTTTLDKIINRTWIATDANGNTSFCAQSILVERISLDDVVFPPHFDGNDQPSLDCDAIFDTDDEGNPSTSVTGTPSPTTCHYIDFLYSDTVIPLCGGGYKVLRDWEAIDWCLVETTNMNQVIKVDDTSAPVFDCVQDITVSTSVYDCESNDIVLDLPTNVTDCSTYTTLANVQSISGTVTYPVTETQTQLTVNNLPIGIFNVIYTVTDDCGNSASCTSSITVIDDVEPYPVCDEFTSTSISSDGTARVFASVLDDGSSDNCEIVDFQVAKMTDECGFGLSFGDYVDFCCDEVNDTIMVALQITDASGNANTCMVSVIVEDKIAPVITAPTDLTIACDTYYDINDLAPFGSIQSDINDIQNIIINDAYNNGIAGEDGYFNDNCNATVTSAAVENIDCYEGSIIRTFTVTDEFGMTSTTSQSITIQNADYIVESDIVWPMDVDAIGCQDIESDTSMTGVPVLNGATCGAIAFEYYDEVFPIADTACVKIIRHWTAIDWCQHNADTGEGYWTDNQIIKLTNNVAPTISNCTDAEICSYDNDCMTADYTFDLSAGDDCTDTLLLQYDWYIDADDNGGSDFSGSTSMIDVTLTHGVHRVYWTVSDACGNVTSCDYLVTVKDCKAPTPYCFSSITTVLMPTSGQVTIWAEDFDFDSFDNCTDVSDLQFSFSEDINDTSWTIDCEDLENGAIEWLPIEMYVTDEDGNQDFCTVQIVIQDNEDYCTDQNPDGIIKGNLRTTSGDRITGVEVEYKDVQSFYVDTTMTNEAGKYTSAATFDNVPYYITPRKMDELTNGVTTLDLVLIQRHLLGFAEFTDPYKIIASDMNGSNSVSSSDIVLLRKVVLGIKNELPNGNMPWRFIPEDWNFMDESSPWDYDTQIYLEPLVDTMQQINFTAVKLGDVNGSYESIAEDGIVETRDARTYNLSAEYSVTDEQLRLSIFGDEELDVDAAQFAIEYDQRALSLLYVLDQKGNLINEDNYSVENGIVKLAEGYVVPQQLDIESAMFTFEFEVVEKSEYYNFDLSESFANLIYENEQAYKLTMDEVLVLSNTDLAIDKEYRLLSNPSTQCIVLSENADYAELNINVIDASGRVVYNNKAQENTEIIEIPDNAFYDNGIYFIIIESASKRSILEYIHID